MTRSDPGADPGVGPEQAGPGQAEMSAPVGSESAPVSASVSVGPVSVVEAGGGGRSADAAVRLVLWRHGQTDWNAERRFQGQSDTPLNSVGHEQARRAARYLAVLRPTAIFSS